MLKKITNLINNNKLTDAFKLIMSAEKNYLNNGEYWFLRGYASLLAREYSVAIDCFSNAINYKFLDANLYYNYAYACSKVSLDVEAAIYYGLAFKYTEDEEVKNELISMYSENDLYTSLFVIAVNNRLDNIIVVSDSTYSLDNKDYVQIVEPLIKLGCNVTFIDRAEIIDSQDIPKSNAIAIRSNVELITSTYKNFGGIEIDSTLTDVILNKIAEFNEEEYLIISSSDKIDYSLINPKKNYVHIDRYSGKDASKFKDVYAHQKMSSLAENYICANIHESSGDSNLLGFYISQICSFVEKSDITDESYAYNNESSKYLISILSHPDKVFEVTKEELESKIKLAPYSSLELRKEILYRYSLKDRSSILALLAIALKRFDMAKEYLGGLDENLNGLYSVYIDSLLDAPVKSSDIAKCNVLLQTNKTKLDSLKVIVNKFSTKTYCIMNLYNNVNLTEELITNLKKNFGKDLCVCTDKPFAKDFGLENINLDVIASNNNIVPLVFWDENYTEEVRVLADYDVSCCIVYKPFYTHVQYYTVDKELMTHIKERRYLHTFAAYRRHASDGNIEAVLRNVPEEMKKYDVHMVDYTKLLEAETMMEVPLRASVTVGGFGIFSSYPIHKGVKNIELWHGGLGYKAIGIIDRNKDDTYKWAKVFANVDYFCIPSQLNKVLYSAMFAIPVHKYELTGLARNDLLMTSDGRGHLSSILNMDLSDKKVIFNLPTFHFNENSNRLEGDPELINSSVKLVDFDYKAFDEFLEKNNAVCISKPHYAEERTVSSNDAHRKYKNLLFFTNDDLDNLSLNLYDVLNAADLLITDYSSVAGDFIYMNKPIVYLCPDLEEYSTLKGLSLEPYDFWAPGPKVVTQEELQSAIQENLENPELYEPQRKVQFPLWYAHYDSDSAKRTWNVIDKAFNSLDRK